MMIPCHTVARRTHWTRPQSGSTSGVGWCGSQHCCWREGCMAGSRSGTSGGRFADHPVVFGPCQAGRPHGGSIAGRLGKSPPSSLGFSAEQGHPSAQVGSPGEEVEGILNQMFTLLKGIPLIAPLIPELQTQVGTSTPASLRFPPVLKGIVH